MVKKCNKKQRQLKPQFRAILCKPPGDHRMCSQKISRDMPKMLPVVVNGRAQLEQQERADRELPQLAMKLLTPVSLVEDAESRLLDRSIPVTLCTP